MRILVGLTIVCVYLLGFGTAVWVIDKRPASPDPVALGNLAPATPAILDASNLQAVPSTKMAAMPVADKDIQEPGSNATEALPSGDVNRTTDASAPTMGQAADPEKPPLAVAMPSPSAGLASASGQADWLARSEGEPLGAGQSESAAEQAVGLYEVERPTGAFYTLAVAEFAHLDSAHALKNDLETQFIEAEVFASGSMAGLDWYTVAVGRFADRFDADRQGRRLSAAMGRQLSPMLLRVAAR